VSSKPLDLILDDLADIPNVSGRYDTVQLLVRAGAHPIGSLTVPNRPRELQPPELRRTIAERFASALWVEVASRSWIAEAAAPLQSGEGPRISVLVCTRNRPHQLEECLARLAAQRHPSYEVIVVDNAPLDEATRTLAERFGVRYVIESRPGLDWARNRGLVEALGPIVAYTDDDARPDPGWLLALERGFVSDDVAAVTGLVAPAELETRAQMLFEAVYGGMGKGFDVQIFSRRAGRATFRPETLGVGCNMAFRAQALRELGGFDPALDAGTPSGGGGDLDALQRVIESGRTILYTPDAVVRHIHRTTMDALRAQLFDNGRAYGCVLCAGFLRARGRNRLRVVVRAGRWLVQWHLRRIVRRLLRRERLPLRLLLAELGGALASPVYYALSRRTARRRAQVGA
jgi:glycosyltransferase involved in cell wall biosynthesis